MEGEAETTRKGTRHLHPWLELGPVNDIIEDGIRVRITSQKRGQQVPYVHEMQIIQGKATQANGEGYSQ